jgi:WD40 repeat protein/DNA polymerase III delta prime subunit
VQVESNSSDIDKQTSTVTIGDVEGGIHGTVIAGRDVTIGQKIINLFLGSTEQQRAQRNRRAMLELVKNTWVKGVLEQSLHGAAMIELGLEERAEAVEHPWDMLVRMPDQPNRALPPGTRIIGVFEEMGCSLLILGEPGSGKTTMLLELARDLIVRAEQDPTQPIPVVFNLSSWAEKRQPIAEWLVEELNAKYYIPKKIARPWVENDELLLLLDGLDEVKADQREPCVKAINDFHQEHLIPLVVCSRSADYEALAARLKLQGAALLEPLTPQQIEGYLVATGHRLAALRTALQHDVVLQELAQSPLMLSVMSLAYQDTPAGMLLTEQPSSMEAHYRHLFAAYVEQMLSRRRTASPYTPQQTISWLIWLAQNMALHNQSVFLIGRLQPSWLRTRAQRWLYMLGSRPIGGLAIGLAMILLFSSWFSVSGQFQFIHMFLLGWLCSGVSVGLDDGMRFERHLQTSATYVPRRPGFGRLIINVAATGFSAMLGFGLVLWAISGSFPLFDLSVALILLLWVGLPFGLIFGLRGQWQRIRGDIQTADGLLWSWRGFLAPVLLISVVLGSAVFAYTSIGFQNWFSNSIIVWDVKGGAELTALAGHTSYINQTTWSADGSRILTASNDGTAWVWDAKTGDQLVTLMGYRGGVSEASWNADGSRILTISLSNDVQVWDARTGAELATLTGHTGVVRGATWNADGSRILTTSDDGTDRVWDAKTGDQLITLIGYTGGDIIPATWSADGSRILTARSDGTARVWDAKTGDQLVTLIGHRGAIPIPSWNADGSRILTISLSNDVQVWDARTGAELATLTGHTGVVWGATWNADGSRILTTSDDGTDRVWDAKTGDQLITLTGHRVVGIGPATWNADGSRILTTSNDGTARVWDAKTGDQLVTLIGHTDAIFRATWNADGSHILTVSNDGTARVWDAETGKQLIVIKGATVDVASARLSPDGAYVVTTSQPSDFRFWSAICLFVGLVLGLFRGLRTSIIDTKTSPDQGVRMSARNAIALGLAGGIFAAVIGGLTSILFKLLIIQGPVTSPLDLALQAFPLLLGLFGCFGILSALWYGGLDIIQHFALRVVLRFKGYIPWNYARFLDYAAERILLRKVGGGYIFIHRLLMEYFASLESGQVK